MLSYFGNSISNILGNAKLFSKVAAPFYIHLTMNEGSNFSISSLTLVIFRSLILNHCHPWSGSRVCEGVALTALCGTSPRGGAEVFCHCPHLGSILEMGPFTYPRDPEFAFELNTGITKAMLFFLGNPSLLPDRTPAFGLGLPGPWS